MLFSQCKKNEPIEAQKPLKNGFEQATKNVKNLSVGLLGAIENYQNNDNFKTTDNPITEIIYEIAHKGLDGYYYITYDRLIYETTQQGIDLVALMNNAINGSNADAETIDVAEILSQFNLYSGQGDYHIVIPYIDEQAEKTEDDIGAIYLNDTEVDELQNQERYYAYAMTETEYPINGYKNVNGQVQLEVITKAIAKIKPILISTTLNSLDECLIDGVECHKVIKPCFLSSDPGSGGINCKICNSLPINQLKPDVLWSPHGPNLTDVEFQIDLCGQSNTTGVMYEFDNCIFDCFQTLGNNDTYGYVSVVENFTYWHIDGHIARKLDLETEFPIARRQSNLPCEKGTKLYLCEYSTQFKNGDEADLCSPGLGNVNKKYWLHHGIYQVKQPGLPKLYIAYPFGRNIWPNLDPDSRYFYGFDLQNNSCNNQYGHQFVNITPRSEITLSNYDAGLNLRNKDINVLASYKSSDMTFWRKNVVEIGLTKIGTSSFVCDQNLITFDCITPSNNNIAESSNLLTLETELGKTSYDNEYEIAYTSNTPFPPGSNIIYYLDATFTNNENVNSCNSISKTFIHTVPPLNCDPPVSPEYFTFTVTFRGNIEDYSLRIYRVQP